MKTSEQEASAILGQYAHCIYLLSAITGISTEDITDQVENDVKSMYESFAKKCSKYNMKTFTDQKSEQLFVPIMEETTNLRLKEWDIENKLKN